MGAASLIALVAALLQSILSAAKVGGVPAEIVALIEGALANILKVQGTDVTYTQLESLRVTTEW
jgi:hypothetical protein